MSVNISYVKSKLIAISLHEELLLISLLHHDELAISEKALVSLFVAIALSASIVECAKRNRREEIA